MKLPRLITRRRLKWAGTVAAALILSVTVASRWYRFLCYDGWNVGQGSFTVSEGLVVGSWKQYRDSEVIPTVHFRWRLSKLDKPQILMTPHWNYTGPRTVPQRNVTFSSYYVRVPLWLPLLLIAAPTAWLWYTDRRAKPWQCATCRYDLRGLNVRAESGPTAGNGVCPECGSPTERKP